MTQVKHTPYEQGFIDGLTCYAINKDGCQWVGSSGVTLKTAIERKNQAWNFNPAVNNYDALVGALKDFAELAAISKPNCGKKLRDLIQKAQEKHEIALAGVSS